MTEEQDMYRSHDYKMLMKACDNGDKAEIEAWYTQLCMGYGPVMLEHEIGTAESLIKSHCQ